MIVMDGRTDREKLMELLQLPEETHLEFKSGLDLAVPQDQLNFVKDAVSMMNRPPGGYILIGVDDNGHPAMPVGTLADRALFDGARLGDLIRKYIEGETHVISQIHEIDGREIVVICLPHHRDGLPVPMSKLGQYPGSNGKPAVVFREGDVLVREGAKNTPLRHAHWVDLLSRRDQRLREEARAPLDSMVTELATAMRRAGNIGPTVVPLTIDMADDAFHEAVLAHLETGNDLRIRQLLAQATALVSTGEQHESALNKITILAAQAMFFERDVVAAKSIDTLFEAYSKLTRRQPAERLDIVTRAYALGSLAVRLRRWSVLHDLVLRPVTQDGTRYVYSSWLRHGQVEASRASLFPADRTVLLISAARDLMREHPAMRPDVPDSAVSDPSEFASDDVLFNSLCQFDILYCLIAAAEGKHEGGGYPAASAIDQERANPAFELVAVDENARRQLFPSSDDERIAEIVNEVFETAKRESSHFGWNWWHLPDTTTRFVASHSQQSR